METRPETKPGESREAKPVRKRRKAWVRREECVACGCCVKVCPRQALEIVKGLFARVEEKACVGCGRCERECPAGVVEMREVEE